MEAGSGGAASSWPGLGAAEDRWTRPRFKSELEKVLGSETQRTRRRARATVRGKHGESFKTSQVLMSPMRSGRLTVIRADRQRRGKEEEETEREMQMLWEAKQ
jgi:hypothetical protein